MKPFLICIFCFVNTSLNAQVIFQRTYSHQTSSEANTACKTLDGGFLMAGRTSDGINILYSDCYLVKTDSLGNVQWRKAYGGSGYEEVYSIVSVNDGGYVFTGITSSFTVGGDADIFMIKIDDTGKIVWQKLYGGYSSESPQQIKKTSDSGFVIIGSHAPFGGGVQVYLLKTDSIGNLLWTKTYSADNCVNGKYVNQTKDGGYIITGNHFYVNGSGDMYAMKTNSAGNIVWAKSYGITTGEWH